MEDFIFSMFSILSKTKAKPCDIYRIFTLYSIYSKYHIPFLNFMCVCERERENVCARMLCVHMGSCMWAYRHIGVHACASVRLMSRITFDFLSIEASSLNQTQSSPILLVLL